MLGFSMDKWSTSISVLHCIYLRHTNKTRALPGRRIDVAAEGQAVAYHSYHFVDEDTVSQPLRVRIRVNIAAPP